MKYLSDDELKALIAKCECVDAGMEVEPPDWKDIIESLNELLQNRDIQQEILELLDEPG